jgi:hypothetical protein
MRDGASDELPTDVVRFRWEGHVFDQEDGIGNVPDVAEVHARGIVAFMTPSKFLDLCPHQDLDPAGIRSAIAAGRPVSMGFLRVDLWEELPTVVGHEGRHRMAALRDLSGDVPFPVALLFANGVRARGLDDGDVRRLCDGMVSQALEDEAGTLVDGPLFSAAVLRGREVPELTDPLPGSPVR